MKDWTPEAIEYWNDRASEPLRFESYPDDICDAINRKHPLPSEDEIWEIIRESQNG